MAVVAVIVIAIATDETNAERFPGAEEKPVAQVVDDVETRLRDDDVDFVCSDLFTPSLSQRIQLGGGKSCAAVLSEDEGFQVELEAQSIDVTGTRATARVKEGDDEQTWRFVRVADEWRVDDLIVD